MVGLQRRYPPNSEFARKYYNVYCTWSALCVLGECWNDSSRALKLLDLSPQMTDLKFVDVPSGKAIIALEPCFDLDAGRETVANSNPARGAVFGGSNP